MEHRRPLADLEVVAEPRPEPLELGVIPEQLGRVFDAGAGHHAVLGEQSAAEMLEQLVGRAAATAPVVEVGGERLDPLELALDRVLVVGQRHALGEHVGHELKLLPADVGEDQRAALHRLLAGGLDADVEHLRLLVGRRVGLADVRRELAEVFVDRRGRDVEEHDRPVAKDHGHAVARRPLAGDRGPQRRADQFHDERGVAGAVGGAERGDVDRGAHQDRPGLEPEPLGSRRARGGGGGLVGHGSGTPVRVVAKGKCPARPGRRGRGHDAVGPGAGLQPNNGT